MILGFRAEGIAEVDWRGFEVVALGVGAGLATGIHAVKVRETLTSGKSASE